MIYLTSETWELDGNNQHRALAAQQLCAFCALSFDIGSARSGMLVLAYAVACSQTFNGIFSFCISSSSPSTL